MMYFQLSLEALKYLSKEYNKLFLPSAEHFYTHWLVQHSCTCCGGPEVHLEAVLQRMVRGLLGLPLG